MLLLLIMMIMTKLVMMIMIPMALPVLQWKRKDAARFRCADDRLGPRDLFRLQGLMMVGGIARMLADVLMERRLV